MSRVEKLIDKWRERAAVLLPLQGSSYCTAADELEQALRDDRAEVLLDATRELLPVNHGRQPTYGPVIHAVLRRPIATQRDALNFVQYLSRQGWCFHPDDCVLDVVWDAPMVRPPNDPELELMEQRRLEMHQLEYWNDMCPSRMMMDTATNPGDDATERELLQQIADGLTDFRQELRETIRRLP